MEKNYVYEGNLYTSTENLLKALEKNRQIEIEPNEFKSRFPLNDKGFIQFTKEALLAMFSTFYMFTSKEVMLLGIEALTGYCISDCEKIFESGDFQSFLKEFTHNKYIHLD